MLIAHNFASSEIDGGCSEFNACSNEWLKGVNWTVHRHQPVIPDGLTGIAQADTTFPQGEIDSNGRKEKEEASERGGRSRQSLLARTLSCQLQP